MSDNIQRARGRPQGYKFDRGGTPAEFGPFIGIVKNNLDPTRSGRLQVYIEQFGGDNPEDTSLWRTVMYVPPFYGVTPRNNATKSTGDGSYKGNQQSYGMWFTPPDIGVQVICFFVSGDPNQGYYIGCVPEAGVSHMIPAVGASRQFTTKNAQQQTEISAAGAQQLPVVEINSENDAISQNPRFFDQPKPIHDYVYAILYNQGLLGDYIRGPISSSSQRESPSAVFGFSTPGRPIYQGGLSEKDIKQRVNSGQVSLADVKVEGRRGGHSIVLDDGDLQGRDNLIRIRTAKGHQITMSDESDCFYFIAANGQTWIELGSEGTVDVFSTNSVNVRSQGEINLHSDKDININAGQNLNIRAGNVAIESQNTTTISSVSDFTMYSKTKLGVLSDGSISLQSEKGGWKSNGDLTFKGSRIDLNGGPAPESVTTPKPIAIYTLDDTSLVPGTGWVVQPKKIETIVPRAPTHEPYPYHNKGVPVEIELDASTADSPSPAVQSAIDSSAAAPLESPPVSDNASSLASTPVETNSASTVATSAGTDTASLSAGVPSGIAASVNASDVLTTDVADVKVGSLSKNEITGLLAQAKSAVGQASDAISVDKGIGQFGLKPTQLESAGFLKPGTLATLASSTALEVTDADIKESQSIINNGGSLTPEEVAKNRKINKMLASPTVWTGKSGVTGLKNLLGSVKLQSATQQGLLASSLTGLKNLGLATGNESSKNLSGLIQASTVIGVGSMAKFVKGIAPPGVAAAIKANIKGAQFSTKFVQDNIGEFGGFAKAAESATNTVNRSGVDAGVKNALGDLKIPAPEFSPVEREPDVPTEASKLTDEAVKIVDAAVTFLKSVNTLVDEAIQKARTLDSQQPLTASQISAFESQRDSYRTLFNNNWKSVYLPQIKSLDDAKYDSIREDITSTLAIVYRLVNLISSISIAQKQQIEQWKINANTNT